MATILVEERLLQTAWSEMSTDLGRFGHGHANQVSGIRGRSFPSFALAVRGAGPAGGDRYP
ncbi:hypothetical protein ACU686_11615 [Yinghuangia aomiensis]